MAEWLRDQGLPINPRLFELYTPDEVPEGPRIEALIKGGTGATPDPWERPLDMLKVLRYGYLHVSFDAATAAYGLVSPNLVRTDKASRRPYRRVNHG